MVWVPLFPSVLFSFCRNYSRKYGIPKQRQKIIHANMDEIRIYPHVRLTIEHFQRQKNIRGSLKVQCYKSIIPTSNTTFIKGNNFLKYACWHLTLFGFPIGRLKSETIFPIGIAHWLKWPSQIFQKKKLFSKIFLWYPKVGFFRVRITLGDQRKFFEKSGLAISTTTQCQ